MKKLVTPSNRGEVVVSIGQSDPMRSPIHFQSEVLNARGVTLPENFISGLNDAHKLSFEHKMPMENVVWYAIYMSGNAKVKECKEYNEDIATLITDPLE
jgi:hypothetical protein